MEKVTTRTMSISPLTSHDQVSLLSMDSLRLKALYRMGENWSF